MVKPLLCQGAKEVGGKDAPCTIPKLIVFDILEKSRSLNSIHTCLLEQTAFLVGSSPFMGDRVKFNCILTKIKCITYFHFGGAIMPPLTTAEKVKPK